MTLVEIRALLELRDNPNQNCDEVNVLLDGHIQQVEARMETLLQLKQRLVVLRNTCTGARAVESCGILHGLSVCSVSRSL